jgi:FkbM family methyltransferase
MEKPLYKTVRYENPFVNPVPSIFLKSFFGKSRIYSPEKKISRVLSKVLYQILKLSHINWQGQFEYINEGERNLIRFNERNMQFHSVYDSRFKTFGYEPESIALLNVLVHAEKKGTFFDIGSNWGHYSLFVASINSNFDIHSFEPFPETYKDLVSTVMQANLQKRITHYQLALSDKEGAAFIHLDNVMESGSASIKNDRSGIAISTDRIDNLDIQPPTIMKIDAEDHEDKVLEGGEKTISQYKPFIIFESHLRLNSPNTTIRPLKILQDLDYVFFQPAMLFDDEDGMYSVSFGNTGKLQTIKEGKIVNNGEIKLALFEFSPEQRFLLDKQFNVFACPKNKIAFIKSVFNNLHTQ